ncbi:MAG: hypothetical protein HYU67_01450 [Flavobacteriia bacterium]|nr:hypothetical protein [Flavobacteriia bacterium]
MTSIFVAKLDYGVTNEELKNLFESFGKVSKVSIPIDKQTGKSKGFAFVEMFNEQEALQAIKNLDQSSVRGRQIAVKIAENRSDDNRNKTESNQNRSTHFEKSEEKTDLKPIIDPSIVIPTKIFEKKKDPVKKKGGKSDYDDGKPRPKKMETYKKSGKGNRFFDFDDDDDF